VLSVEPFSMSSKPLEIPLYLIFFAGKYVIFIWRIKSDGLSIIINHKSDVYLLIGNFV